MDLSKKYPIIKYLKGKEEQSLDALVIEYQLEIFIDGKIHKRILCSPEALKELTAGILITENIVHSLDEVERIKVDEEKKVANVSLLKQSTALSANTGTNAKTNTISVQQSVEIHQHLLTGREVIEKILSLFQKFITASELFTSTGGVHSCAVCNERDIVYQHDDISRQNALDKVIGGCALDGIELSDKILFTTCRISSEIMMKVIHSGIKCLVSKSAPTDQAVELAKSHQIQLIGFVRGDRMNIYV